MRRLRQACAGLSVGLVRRWDHHLALAVTLSAVVFSATVFATQTRRPTGRPPAPAAARHAPLKAIFEPVSYAQDVDISDLFFVDAEVGWACGHHITDAGDGGFIIATRDGGKTWSAQFGAPQSPARAFVQLSFVDATHGWAIQIDGTLLRTTDGTRWTRAGTVNPVGPVVFTSPEKGFFLDRGRGVKTTIDGGRTWRLASVGEPEAIAFAPDNLTGYVVRRALDNKAVAIMKTVDGGEGWTLASVIPDVSVTDVSLAFSDPSTGYLRAAAALKMTSDGGHTWHDAMAQVPYDVTKVLVAGAVGWMIGSHDFSYTLDGGKRWTTRQVSFPAHVITFALPCPDSGYVAGRHGMIYRFRIVPFEYSVPNMLTVPGMTTFVQNSS